MDLPTDFIQVVQDVVLHPDWSGAIIIFLLSFANELIAVLPYSVILSGQLLFLDSSLSLALVAKLFVFVAIPVGVGSVIGTLPVYAVAYFGGKPAIEKFHKYLHFSWQDVERVNLYFKGKWYDKFIFLVLRSVPFFPSLPFNVVAGIIRMRFFSYFVLSIIGFTIRMVLTLIIIGLGMGALSKFLIFIYNS